LQELVPTPTAAGVVGIVLALGAVAIWGITESVVLASVITCIEVGGLGYIVVSGRHVLTELPARLPEMLPPLSLEPWPGILSGAFLAFYAMIGFEDMVNVAEEVREPRRNLPLGILLAIAITTALYVASSAVAVLAVSPEALAASRSPFALVLGGETSSVGVTLVGMLAGLNGALVQIIMASRILYGMAGTGNAPSSLHRVSETTRTPVRATLLATGLVLAFALWLPIVTLAQLTSGIILCVFALVNLALVVIKWRSAPAFPGAPDHPLWVPALGLVLCAGVLLFQLASLLADS
jgi:amino acid transporter